MERYGGYGHVVRPVDRGGVSGPTQNNRERY